MYCLSGMKFSFHLKAKQTFIDKYYGNDIEVISTSEQELKLKGIRVLAKLNNCKLTEILFVDDNLDVIALLEKNGVKAIHVDNISQENENEYIRFIVIDNKELYHCGASLKDLGKKCFAISKIEDMEYIQKISCVEQIKA